MKETMTKEKKAQQLKDAVLKLLLNNKRGCANYRAADKLIRQLRYTEQTKCEKKKEL